MFIMKLKLQHQKGVGLMEILVALLILSVGILGFVALQVRATVATGEALKRSDAMLILSGLGEKIRINSSGNYKVTIPTTEPACVSETNCNSNNQALADLYNQNQIALSKGIKLGVVDCVNTSTSQPRLCLIAAWNNTNPTIAASSVKGTCLNSSDGKYLSDADCLVLEAY